MYTCEFPTKDEGAADEDDEDADHEPKDLKDIHYTYIICYMFCIGSIIICYTSIIVCSIQHLKDIHYNYTI